MMKYLPDHGLPLVQLKEQRRDLVVALQNRNGPVSGAELMQIAAESADPKVNVFRRFALMRNWVDAGIPLDCMDDQGSDHLHTSAWATDCVAQSLYEAIVNSPQ